MSAHLQPPSSDSWLSHPMPTVAAPAVSVIVPVFGTEAHLPACLRSLLRQSLRDVEVIVVDDGSPADVADVVLRAGGGDPRLRLVHHPTNRGTLRARLTGASRAIAPYLAFVDPDDVVDERFLEILLDTATRYDADLVQCGIKLVETDGTTSLVNRGGASYCLNNKSVLAELLAGKMSNSIANKLVRAACWQAATWELSAETYRLVFGEDLLLLFLLASRSASFAHVADPLYRYIRRADSATMAAGEAASRKRGDDLNFIFASIFARLHAIDEPDDLKAAFYRREFPGIALPSDVSALARTDTKSGTRSIPDGVDALRICFLLPATGPGSPPAENDSVASIARAARLAGHRVTLAQSRPTGTEILDMDGESGVSCVVRPFTGLLAGAPVMQAAYQTYLFLCQEQFDLVCASALGGALHYAITSRAQRLALGSTRFGVVVERLTSLSRYRAREYGDGLDDLIAEHMERTVLAGADLAAIVDSDAAAWMTQRDWTLPSHTYRALPECAGQETMPADRSEAIWREMLGTAIADEGWTIYPHANSVQVTQPPQVSVCITHFNRPALLKQAVQSIRLQTHPNLQIVIVDDASTDPEAAVVLDELAHSLGENGIVVRHQANRYLGAARNTAVRHTRGEFVFFLDDDDYAHPHQVETLVRAALATAADIVTSFCDRFAGTSPPEPGQMPAERWLMLGNAPSVGFFRNVFGPSAALFRRSALETLGGFSEVSGVGAEDWELFARAALKGLNLQTVPQALFWYRQTPRSMCATGSSAANHTRACAPYLALVPDVIKNILETALSADHQLQTSRHEIAAEQHKVEALRYDAQVLRELIDAQRASTVSQIDVLRAEIERLRNSHDRLEADLATLSDEAADLRAVRLSLLPGDGETPQTAVDALWYSHSWRATRFVRALPRLGTGHFEEPTPQVRTWAEAAHVVATVQHSSSWELAAPLRMLRRHLTRLRKIL